MEAQEVILGRAIRLVKVSTAAGYWPDLVKDLGKEFSFASLPDVQEILLAQTKGTPKGAEFQLGKVTRPDGTIAVIDKLTVFNDGLVVDSRISTDDSDLLLDSIEQWAKKNVSGIKNTGKSFYLSQLEVKLGISKYAKAFDHLSEQVVSLLKEYGSVGITPYEFSSLYLAMEQSRLLSSQPSPFSIERRSNISFEENVFFAQAPLKTHDHLRLLVDLEKTLASI
jgi:hypothetical protein